MFNETKSNVPDRETIKQRVTALEQEIGRREAAKETSPELDTLHAEYESLQEQLKATDHQDHQAAA